MDSLFSRVILSLIAVLLSYLFFSLDFFIAFGLGVFVFIMLSLISGFGKRIPIGELFSFIVFLQLFISPLITYEYFDNQASFTMYVPQEIYMGYALPALIAFSLGLNLRLFKSNVKINSLRINVDRKGEHIALIFIILGLMSTILLDKIPSTLRFIFYLMVMLKFVGAFMLLFSNNKFKWFWILLVYFQFTIETISGGVFYDLFVWVGFLYILLELKWKSSIFRKLTYFVVGFFIIYFIQSIKREYRELTWQKEISTEDRTEVFFEVASERIGSENNYKETTNFDRFISRLNTGWIISKVMEHTPAREPFANGELLIKDIESVFLPRFLFPNKSSTGGEANRDKFTRFTGRRLLSGTIMRVGAFSDAYINFGVVGGWLCMFVLGLVFNFTLKSLYSLARSNPIYLLWIPFIFAYAIRMSDFQVILNYTFKAYIFVIGINYLFFINKKK